MKALLLIDIQNDFMPGGPLGVPKANEIFPFVNEIQNDYGLVIATQDWHPADHKSFASNNGKSVGEVIDLEGLQQIMWPDHAVQMTTGSQLAPKLDQRAVAAIFRKGTKPNIDSYSAFADNGHRHYTQLDAYLKAMAVEEVHIVGLATDYCVKFSALDAHEAGFETVVLTQGCRGVNLNEGDVDAALEELRRAGVEVR